MNQKELYEVQVQLALYEYSEGYSDPKYKKIMEDIAE